MHDISANQNQTEAHPFTLQAQDRAGAARIAATAERKRARDTLEDDTTSTANKRTKTSTSTDGTPFQDLQKPRSNGSGATPSAQLFGPPETSQPPSAANTTPLAIPSASAQLQVSFGLAAMLPQLEGLLDNGDSVLIGWIAEMKAKGKI